MDFVLPLAQRAPWVRDVQQGLGAVRHLLVVWEETESCKGTDRSWVLPQPLSSARFPSAGHSSSGQPGGGSLLRKPSLFLAALIARLLRTVRAVGQSPGEALGLGALAQGIHGCEACFVSAVLAFRSQNSA